MTRYITYALGLGMVVFSHSLLFAQETAKVIVNDSLKDFIQLQGVVVADSTKKASVPETQANPTQNTDEIIECLPGVSLIRRGNYAAEPTFRGMNAGQLSMTIDGMKIFSACTDKMDPISSYISSNNLSSISLSSNSNHGGQSSNIGGGFDFNTITPQLHPQGKLSGLGGVGYTTNGNGTTGLLSLNYGDSSWAINGNANYQKFHNYQAGGGETIKYTQFEKINFALSGKWLLSSSEVLSAQFIYDDALNVGYPALPMDVSFAGGRIYSISYKKYFSDKWDGSVLVKAYGNRITHIMDDTQRDSVAMHMDMPGWSNTHGIYAMGEFRLNNKHTILINPDYYTNYSFAEMTMYPDNEERPDEPAMYMITWPEVRRHSGSLGAIDQFKISSTWKLNSSVKMEYVTSRVESDFGQRQMEAIGQDGTVPYGYFLFNVEEYAEKKLNEKWKVGARLGYAERQPTVSEGFGFYLYNSMDGFDYIGNPELKKEKAFKAAFNAKWQSKNTRITGQIYHYKFQDYILGEVTEDYQGMTIGSNGVKLYENIPSASISGFELGFVTVITKNWVIENNTQLSYGVDNEGVALPLIPPLQNNLALVYRHKKFTCSLVNQSAATQEWVRSDAGETRTPGYSILNLNAQIPFSLKKTNAELAFAANNIFDANYWSHLDWNSIPRPGRSFIIQMRVKF